MSSDPSTYTSTSALRGCRVGANPIIWSNDDFPELGGTLSLDECLAEMRAAGYAGSELGHKYPRTADALARVLGAHELQLVSGWHSTYLAMRDLAAEERSFKAHLALLQSLGASVAIVAECSRCVHGARDVPLGFNGGRPELTAEEWRRVCAGFQHLAGLTREVGMTLVYHHHMGTVVQSEPELDLLLDGAPALNLLLDPGHLTFAGIDPLRVMDKHGPRIGHVHLKSVRPEIVARVRREGWSFCRAVSEGVFTIPGDGTVDFPAIFRRLVALQYRGWLVVEAEEDPAKAPPLEKARRAREYVRHQASV